MVDKNYVRESMTKWSHDSQHLACGTHERIGEGGHYNEIGFRLARSQAAFIKSAISSPSLPTPPPPHSLTHSLFFIIIHSLRLLRPYSRRRTERRTCLLPFTPFSFLAFRRSRANVQWWPRRLYCSMVSSVHRRGLRGNKTVMHVKRLTVTRRIQFSPHSCISRSQRANLLSAFLYDQTRARRCDTVPYGKINV